MDTPVIRVRVPKSNSDNATTSATAAGRVIKFRTTPVTPATPAASRARVHVRRRNSRTPNPITPQCLFPPGTPTTPAARPRPKIRVKGAADRTQPSDANTSGPLASKLAAALENNPHGDMPSVAPTPFVSRFIEVPLHATRISVIVHVVAVLPACRLAVLLDSHRTCALLKGDVPALDTQTILRDVAVDERRHPAALVRFVVDQGDVVEPAAAAALNEMPSDCTVLLLHTKVA